MAVVKLATIKEAGACQKQVRRFKKMFGEEAKVTITKAKEVAKIFDFDWAADNLLNYNAANQWWGEYDQAYQEFYDCSDREESLKLEDAALVKIAVNFARLYNKKVNRRLFDNS